MVWANLPLQLSNTSVQLVWQESRRRNNSEQHRWTRSSKANHGSTHALRYGTWKKLWIANQLNRKIRSEHFFKAIAYSSSWVKNSVENGLVFSHKGGNLTFRPTTSVPQPIPDCHISTKSVHFVMWSGIEQRDAWRWRHRIPVTLLSSFSILLSSLHSVQPVD